MHVELHPVFKNQADAAQAAELISACVHCGFCLATCPTYLDARDERDSPRGRIYLLKQLLEQGESSEATLTHLDRCLTCRSCETTCPSGMRYGRLLDLGRVMAEQQAPRPLHQRWFRRTLRFVLTRPALFGLALRCGQLCRPLLPATLGRKIPPRQAVRAVPAPTHKRRMLLLEGCVQKAATPATNAAARRVMDRLGINLVPIPGAGCCGAVDHHLGATEDGLDHMRRNIDAWWPALESGAEAVVSSASGCGTQLAEYGELLASDPDYADKARRVSALSRDLSQVLLAEDPRRLAPAGGRQRIAVHTPCSLQHGLGLPDTVATLLRQAGFELTTTRDDHLCCGSAGTYSILQPERSERLRARKLQALEGDQPDLIATANVGCQLHLQEGAGVPVKHWIELLDPG
jgi:glycolate oxidase iron-sulfur subunit